MQVGAGADAPRTAPVLPARAARSALKQAVTANALLAVLGCHRGAKDGFELRREVGARHYAVTGSGAGSPTAAGGERPGLRFRAAPQLGEIEIDHERRPVVLATTATWTWRGRVPARARLHAGVQVVPAIWPVLRGVEVAITVRHGSPWRDRREREVLQVARGLPRSEPQRWLDLAADLGDYAGQEVELDFAVTLAGLPRRYRAANVVAWGPVAVSPAAPPPAAHPNIVFILIDTLRRDHLQPYGYRRETSPEIAARLAVPGTVMEEAYSQAPWTLPSVASALTGRYPGELLGLDITAYGIPAAATPLAERMAKLGFATGGFVANPTLQAKDGFGRGFETLFVPPPAIEEISKHADELNRHALPWLSAHQDRPFFLYAHYVDPHDPYENPEIVANRSPFESRYDGPVAGNWVHGFYSGQLVLPNPARDLAHLTALYDSEVHYVDRFVGQLLAALDPAVLANTLVVLTADHGEELLDHGGWKHGHTLYDEQIHVPLIFRWDGHIAAGRRLGGTVRLLDLVPTLIDAAGGTADPRSEGLDLLPYLTGKLVIPDRPAFAATLAGDPLRVAAILGKTKLILFNREAPFAPANELQRYLWAHDLSRLARVEAYDLAHDPLERHNLAAGGGLGPPATALLQAVIDRRLDLMLPGLRLIAHALPAGSRLAGSVRFERPPARCLPYFLAAADHFELHGDRLDFDLAADAVNKGLLVEGDTGRLLAVAAAVAGRPLSGAAIRLGTGTPYAGGPVTAAALGSRTWPEPPNAIGPALLLWRHDDDGGGTPRQPHDSELEQRLRALGYF